jgi:AraC family transcriptional regulator
MQPRLMAEAQRVHFTPPQLFERRNAQWQGLQADMVTAVQRSPFDYGFKQQRHLLIASEHSERDDGETSVEGLPKSWLHSLSGRRTFVPAGHAFYGWQRPQVLTRVSYFYLDPRAELLQNGLRFGDVGFAPRLFFRDLELWRIAAKLKDEALNRGGRLPHYGEALVVLLAHELIRLNGAPAPGQAVARGGLSGWRQKRVTEFIEAHLAEEVRLATLAQLVDLSPYHFVRAFGASFGVPPHRYHVGRRIERAKALLAEPANSVTEIARALGFAETSSFSTTFRKLTGTSPSNYRRGLA